MEKAGFWSSEGKGSNDSKALTAQDSTTDPKLVGWTVGQSVH